MDRMTQASLSCPFVKTSDPRRKDFLEGRVVSWLGVSQTEELPRVWDFQCSHRDSSRQTRISVSQEFIPFESIPRD